MGVQRRLMAVETMIWCYPRTVGNVTTFQPGGILVRKQEWEESTHNKKQNTKRQRERPTWMLENQSSAQTVQNQNFLPSPAAWRLGSPAWKPLEGALTVSGGRMGAPAHSPV